MCKAFQNNVNKYNRVFHWSALQQGSKKWLKLYAYLDGRLAKKIKQAIFWNALVKCTPVENTNKNKFIPKMCTESEAHPPKRFSLLLYQFTRGAVIYNRSVTQNLEFLKGYVLCFALRRKRNFKADNVVIRPILALTVRNINAFI